jgi:hypothetical protein
MSENSTLVHEGVTYRKVNRKANVGEKVLVTKNHFPDEDNIGKVLTVTVVANYSNLVDVDYQWADGSAMNLFEYEYVVLEPIAELDEMEKRVRGKAETQLTLTEADVRNNPRQVIDMFTSLALNNTKLAARLTLLEGEHQALGERVERLGDSVEQAVSTVARNVETWAQETEGLKRKVAGIDERTHPYQQAHELFVKIAGGLPRELTAEERREL